MFGPQDDLGICDPIWGTQYVVRNSCAMIWDTLYGVDAELRDDQFDSGPVLLAENLVHWSGYPKTLKKYLFVGDSDLWHFAVELASRHPVALHQATLKQAHRFSTMEELVNDMMQQALGDFDDETEDSEDESDNHSAGFHFSRN